jgi:acyl-coenzyme A thioesterase PaaI-like protein
MSALSHHRVQDQPSRSRRRRAHPCPWRVVKAGRTLTLAQAEVFANTGGQEKLIALLTATLMAVKGRDDVSD